VSAAPAYRVLRVRISPRDPEIRLVTVERLGTLRLCAGDVATLGVVEGTLLPDAVLRRARRLATRREARAVALRLLRRRLRSRAELEEALRRRGYARDDVAAVVADLARVGWIDDARFARAWIVDRLRLRPSGRRRLFAELAARGVNRDVIRDALAAALPAADEEELALLQAAARSRRLQGVPPAAARRRLASWLQRRGFDGAAVGRAVRAVLGPADREGDGDAVS
jgi:regulatory protein